MKFRLGDAPARLKAVPEHPEQASANRNRRTYNHIGRLRRLVIGGSAEKD
jgi:hypothetical protein